MRQRTIIILEHHGIRVSPGALSPCLTNLTFYALALGCALTLSTLSLLRYLSFHLEGYDLGIFDQVVWNSLHGRLFENSILPDAPLLIGQRFSPILLALVPFYAVWSSPMSLSQKICHSDCALALLLRDAASQMVLGEAPVTTLKIVRP